MKAKWFCIPAIVVAMLAAPAALNAQPYPVGTAFNYQGRLLDGGLPAEGDYDFEFTLYDDPAAGSVVGGPIVLDDWPVTGGLFTAPLDFGSGVFTGDACWLEISVRPWDSAGAYTVLTPRQELTPAPHALRASNGVGGPEALNVDAADNVGIGMSTPNHKLEVTHATGGQSAIFAEHTLLNSDTPAIRGEHIDSTNGFGIGVQGRGGYIGVDGVTDRSVGYAAGVRGSATGTSTSDSYGVKGNADAAGPNYGVYGTASGGTTNWAGYFPTGNGYFGGDVGIGTTSVGAHKLAVTHATVGESAIFAEHTLASNNTPAILGEHIDSANGRGLGVRGIGGYMGLWGEADRSDGYGYGVYGKAIGASTDDSYGVYGLAGGAGANYAVYGTTLGGTPAWGGYFEGDGYFSGDVGIGTTSVGNSKLTVTHAADGESAIFAVHTLASDNTPAISGVHMDSANDAGIGVYGSGGQTGVYGEGGTHGVRARVFRSAGSGMGILTQVWGTTPDSCYGIFAEATSDGTNIAVYGLAYGGTSNRAGYFSGDVHVSGTLSKSAGLFKIDHPLDPENKYLCHSFVESPDMMNVYNGNVILDGNGEATVEMAEWFDTLNRDFRYQLTAIGAPGPNLYVAKKINNNRFKIAGGKAGMEVSWQVTGIRQDPYANAHRIPVEETKSDKDRGLYEHPKAYGLGEERGIDYRHRVEAQKHHPAAMQQPEEAASDSLEDVEAPDLPPRIHAPETREDAADDSGNAIEPAGLSDAGGAR